MCPANIHDFFGDRPISTWTVNKQIDLFSSCNRAEYSGDIWNIYSLHHRSRMPEPHYISHKTVGTVVFGSQSLLNFGYEFLALCQLVEIYIELVYNRHECRRF